MDYSADDLFRAFGDSGRRELFRLLSEAALTVGEIVEILEMPQSTVSRQLKALRGTGLLHERRQGNRTFCTLVEPVSNGRARLPDLLNQWLRAQPLSAVVRSRLERVLESRNGGEDAFERLAHQWDDLRRRYFGGIFQFEALLALLPREWNVLDVGTGTGYLLPTLARHFRRVTAVDPSPAMLSLARQRAEREGLDNLVFSFGQLEDLPLEPAVVDAALAVLVFHHCEDLGRAAVELHRVLRPGGNLLVVDFHPHAIPEFQREMGDPRAGVDPQIVRQGLREAGLRVEVSRSLPPPPSDLPEGPRQEAPELFVIKGVRPV